MIKYRERINVPVASGSFYRRFGLANQKYDFYSWSIIPNLMLIMLVLVYLPHFEILFVSAVMAIAGTRWATKTDVMNRVQRVAINDTH